MPPLVIAAGPSLAKLLALHDQLASVVHPVVNQEAPLVIPLQKALLARGPTVQESLHELVRVSIPHHGIRDVGGVIGRQVAILGVGETPVP